MNSIHPETQALFECYKELINAPGLECNMYYEALIFEATRMGLTPEKLRIVFLARKKAVREGKPAKGTFIRHLFGTEATGDVLDEAANLEGMSRIRIFDPAKASVLKATGRAAEDPNKREPKTPEQILRESEALRAFRESAG